VPPEPLVDRCVAPFFRDHALWPVALVLVAHVALGVAISLLEVWRDPGGFGLGALALLGAGSVACFARDLVERRLGVTSRALALCWALGALAAWGAARSGLY
jgi:hypothetical protein